MLQGLLPRTPVPALRARPGPIRRDWATVVCFSCGKAGHGVGRCPELNETFPFMLPGWTAEKVGGSYVMSHPEWPWNVTGWKTETEETEGGQPPGSVMEFDPKTPVVVRCGSLPLGMRSWCGRCLNRPEAGRHYTVSGTTVWRGEGVRGVGRCNPEASGSACVHCS